MLYVAPAFAVSVSLLEIGWVCECWLSVSIYLKAMFIGKPDSFTEAVTLDWYIDLYRIITVINSEIYCGNRVPIRWDRKNFKLWSVNEVSEGGTTRQ